MEDLQKLLQEAEYYTPSETVTINPESSIDIDVSGLDRKYAVNRLLFGGSGLNEVTAQFQRDAGKKNDIQPVNLDTLNKHFQLQSLIGVILLQKKEIATLKLTNTSSTNTHKVNAQFLGYDDAHYRAIKQSLEGKDRTLKEPIILTSRGSIPNDAIRQEISLKMPVHPVRIQRMTITSSDNDNLQVSLSQQSRLLKSDTFVSQINDEFSGKPILLPFQMAAKQPLSVMFTNASGAAIDYSMIIETYEV